ncbi:efflux RND transporter permease subunit [Granulicella sibirica]|uniref:Cobalt-zinc-cadmium resistance protein CzcA n=1 Tax=Granulicella sibirica TaxID=2479048 RepID=A0A4Q0T894_9BACT|nr:efflux RND transporter permease subunit [Granulicella sibirica]RXH57831.1 Cobalt-zinc-cadmium resistance protein CzcA [Granulicella sibirica]
MWIVKIALTRPYTFIVLAILILIAAPVVILNTPTDIFPNINIPVVSIAWQYTGLNPEELEGRLTTPYEKALTVLVDNIQHIESTTVAGQVVIKVYLQPGASLDTANSQVSAASEFQLRQLPPGLLPPQIINFSASSVPILQLGLSGDGLSEQQLNDLGLNFVRPTLVTIPGAVIPNVYGGKQRSIMINLDPQQLQAKGLAPQDVLNALAAQNVVQPGGTAKIGSAEYDIHLNSSPFTLEGLSNLPVRQSPNGVIVYLHDVANVSDGSIPQTNIVRQDGHRGVLVTVLKSGTASTLTVVQQILGVIPQIKLTLPPALKITPIGNQAIFVRGSVQGVIREAIIAAVLTGLMILLFLGSWRSTIIIAVSIPLSILSSVIVLGLLGQTINIMTLSGLALAVGILVDDATVTIENIERYLEEGAELHEGILEGAAQIATPALVSTLCICIVFLPMFFLSGVARYLFVPLAESVVFAMIASYILSRTLVPTMAMYLLKKHDHHAVPSNNILARFQRGFERLFERVRAGYQDLLGRLLEARKVFVPVFLLLCLSAFILIPFLGQNFFPATDNGSFILHVRVKSGTRIEETAKVCDEVENAIREVVPPAEMDTVLDNIGLPYSTLNFQHATSGLIGAGDADIMVSLKEDHGPTANYVRTLRSKLPGLFPGTTFYFLPSDIVTQILNFGLPSPIDVQIEGADIAGNRVVLNKILEQLRQVPGLVDLRVQQPNDYPVLNLAVDRTKASQGGYTEKDIGTSVLNILGGSTQLNPQFFLNQKNGVVYNIVAQTPQYQISSMSDLQNIPIASVSAKKPEILADVANVTRESEMEVVSHYNIHRTLDIYGNAQDRDLGRVASQIDKIVKANTKDLPRGSFIHVRGQIDTMRASYIGLLSGLAFAIVLVYLLIVVNFQSWLDPFIIITALPAALAGIVLFLFTTHTTLSVPALMGAIMCMGVATANSILVVSFAKERFEEHGDGVMAALESGATRFRPVMMTALAMIIGMIPMALGAGEGGEQNAPLGRAVIGGLSAATVATLIFVPAVFGLLHGRGKAKANAEQTTPKTVSAGA